MNHYWGSRFVDACIYEWIIMIDTSYVAINSRQFKIGLSVLFNILHCQKYNFKRQTVELYFVFLVTYGWKP